MSETISIAVVTDIHHGRRDETKVGDRALALLSRVVQDVNEWQPDAFIDLGDRITDGGREDDLSGMRRVASLMSQIEVPRTHLLGNHDVKDLSRNEWEDALGTPMSSHVRTAKGWTLIYWQADCHYNRGNLMLPDEDLRWLREAVESATYPAVLFSHVPIGGGSQTGNYYFSDRPEGRAEYHNGVAARRIVTESNSVVLAVAGHTHWNTLQTVDGVHFVTIQSLTESYTTGSAPAGSWCRLELGEKMRIDVVGLDPIALELTPRSEGFHADIRPAHRRVPPMSLSYEAVDFGRGACSSSEQSNALVNHSNGEIPQDLKGILLDLDGVVYRGDELLPGAKQLFSLSREINVRIVAVTNHSGHRAHRIAEKLYDLGIVMPPERIVTSGWVAARHISSLNPSASIFLVGDESLEQEMAGFGLKFEGSPDFVVVGFCYTISRALLEEAVNHLLGGARLVATNRDRLLPTPRGLIPECGPLVAYLESASGQSAMVVGKPYPQIMDAAFARLLAEPKYTMIVGDNPETDIAAGKTAGITTVLIDSDRSRSDSNADLVFRDLRELNSALEASLVSER